MFVAAPVTRRAAAPQPDNPNAEAWDKCYPVVWEDTEQGYTHAPVAMVPEREVAQQIADELNAVLQKHAG